MSHNDQPTHASPHAGRNGLRPYLMLGAMFVLHVIAMYVLMYAMVDRFGNVIPNRNQLYMAFLMASPMVAFELLLMRSMYPSRIWNLLLGFASILVLVGAFALIRGQTAIDDREFLRSMIPHHAGAILMCDRADIRDPEIVALCDGIRAGQQQEIDFMKAKLDALGG